MIIEGTSSPRSLPSRERELKHLNDIMDIQNLRSLPSRERELKLIFHTIFAVLLMSLPSRERELKHPNKGSDDPRQQSLPSRERELKLQEGSFPPLHLSVAPLAGA